MSKYKQQQKPVQPVQKKEVVHSAVSNEGVTAQITAKPQACNRAMPMSISGVFVS